jgi:hypothetical protein
MSDGVAVIFGTGARRPQTPVDASGQDTAPQDTREESPAAESGTSRQEGTALDRSEQEQLSRAQTYAEAANTRRRRRLARIMGRSPGRNDSGRS